MSSKYNWSQIKSALVEFAENLPVEFSSCVLIGGGAALAYRAALQTFNLDHLISATTITEEIGWVSRDADFVSTEVGADEIAAVQPSWVKINESGLSHIEAKGIRLSFVQAPLTFTPD